MAESVVVICSPGEEAVARGLCAAIEARGGACWSPARSQRDSSDAVVDGHIRNAVALVVLSRNALQHQREVELAGKHSIGIVIASPDDVSDAWGTTLADLQLAGAIDTPTSGARAAEFSQPRVYIADDEEKHIEFIAENVSEAQVFVRFGLFDKAIGRLRKVLERAPRNLEAHDELLKIYLEENEHDNAAATAADYLDSLLFRGEEAAYAMLRSHLLDHGFAVDDGPPVAVGAAGGVFRTTRFHGAAAAVAAGVPQPAPAVRHAAEPASTQAESLRHAPEPIPLELPILRNFRASQPALEATGVESDLGGIDFLFDHGMLDEARVRIEQLLGEHPDHPGVLERKQRIDAIAGPRASGLGLSLALDDDWGAPETPERVPPPSAPSPRPEAVATMTAPTPRIDEEPEPAGPAVELVCSVFCPLAVDEGDSFAVQVWLHSADQTEADGVAIVEDRREAAMLAAPVRSGEAIDLSLSLPDMDVAGASQMKLTWSGVATRASFRVTAPKGTAESRVDGWIAIEREGEKLAEVPLGFRVA